MSPGDPTFEQHPEHGAAGRHGRKSDHEGWGHGHGHGRGHSHHHPGEDQLRRILILSSLFLIAEVVGGILSNSLALLSDAGHMMVDVSALLLALFAASQGRRPPDRKRTYGYRRMEVLAALANGVLLVGIAVVVVREAVLRIGHPPEIRENLMLVVAIGGLLVNVWGLWLLRKNRSTNLNLRAAFLHIAGDALGSIGAIAAALVIRFTGWEQADPIASLVISVLILSGAVVIIRDAAHYLLEGAPREISVADVEASLLEYPGVAAIHDLHLWRISSGMDILTAHVVLQDLDAWREAQSCLHERLRERFGIDHATLQMEGQDEAGEESHRKGICDGF